MLKPPSIIVLMSIFPFIFVNIGFMNLNVPLLIVCIYTIVKCVCVSVRKRRSLWQGIYSLPQASLSPGSNQQIVAQDDSHISWGNDREVLGPSVKQVGCLGIQVINHQKIQKEL